MKQATWTHRSARYRFGDPVGAGSASSRRTTCKYALCVAALVLFGLGFGPQAQSATAPNTVTTMQLAEQGIPQAEYLLGVEYDNGEYGLPKDPVRAVYWYMKSAVQGYRRAEARLGINYAVGRGGLTKDMTKAVYWFTQSAAQGDQNGEYNLGVAFYYGYGGLPKDQSKALVLWKQSAAQGSPLAIAALQRLQHARQQVAEVPPSSAQRPAQSIAGLHVAPSAPTVAARVADNQQALQNLRRFWTLYFQASNAQVVDFGEPALVQPVSFGAKS